MPHHSVVVTAPSGSIAACSRLAYPAGSCSYPSSPRTKQIHEEPALLLAASKVAGCANFSEQRRPMSAMGVQKPQSVHRVVCPSSGRRSSTLSALEPHGTDGMLPFSLESMLHTRDDAVSQLSGLDAGPRRALHAMSRRPASLRARRMALFSADMLLPRGPFPRGQIDACGCNALISGVKEDAAWSDGGARGKRTICVARAASGVERVSLRLASCEQVTPPSAVRETANGVSSDGLGAAKLPISPRSLAFNKRRPATRRRSEAVRRRWALVRENLWRLVRDERERLGLSPPESSSASRLLWRAAFDNWETRSAEAALRSLAVLLPMSENEIRLMLTYSSLTTVPRYTRLYRKGLPMLTSFLILQGSVRLSGLRDGTASYRQVLEEGATLRTLPRHGLRATPPCFVRVAPHL